MSTLWTTIQSCPYLNIHSGEIHIQENYFKYTWTNTKVPQNIRRQISSSTAGYIFQNADEKFCGLLQF